MSTAQNGEVEIYYEEFGDPSAPTLLLVNGLGSQCLNYDVEWCQLFCEEGFHVVRFDNRDVGPVDEARRHATTRCADMADDAIAVLDAMGVDKAHVMGCSMGGMIVQRLAHRPHRPPALLDVGDVADGRARLRRQLGGGPGLPAGAAGAVPGGLHRPPGGRPARLRVEARMARRRRHPGPGRRRLRPLLLSRRASGDR